MQYVVMKIGSRSPIPFDSNVLTRLFYNVIKHRKFSRKLSHIYDYSNIVIIQSAGNGYNL